MKRLMHWLARMVATALTVVLIAVLLPYASRWASSILPDLSGAALNTSILLSHQMQQSARLETSMVEDEGVLNASTSAMFLGTVQSVTIRYVYRASMGIDLRKVGIKLENDGITLLLPEVEILSDSLDPVQTIKDDFWYPLTEERRQKLLEDELVKCRKRCLTEYAASDEAWQSAVSALSDTVSAWVSTGGVTIRYERMRRTQ